MDAKILKYVPKKLQSHVLDAYRDDDGYWICFYGTVDNGDGGHVVNGENVKQLREALKWCKLD